MKPKQWRDRLFKTGKPLIRDLEEKDFAVLWGAYKLGTFDIDEGLTQEQFTDVITHYLSGFHAAWVIEDSNSGFKNGIGPIGLMVAAYNGWELEPHFKPFQWATARNKLKAVVGFLHKMKFSKDVGVVNVYSLPEHNDFFTKIKKYGVLLYAGMVPKGDYRGDRYIYYLHGRKMK